MSDRLSSNHWGHGDNMAEQDGSHSLGHYGPVEHSLMFPLYKHKFIQKQSHNIYTESVRAWFGQLNSSMQWIRLTFLMLYEPDPRDADQPCAVHSVSSVWYRWDKAKKQELGMHWFTFFLFPNLKSLLLEIIGIVFTRSGPQVRHEHWILQRHCQKTAFNSLITVARSVKMSVLVTTGASLWKRKCFSIFCL